MSKGLKKGDAVVVIAGATRALAFEKRCGTVKVVDRKKGRVVVEGVNIRKRAQKRTSENPQGGFIEKECAIHISNVMLKDKFDAKRKSKTGKEKA